MSREYFQSAPVFEVPEDSTAATLRHTITEDGVGLDLSGATGSLLFHCRTRSGDAVVTGGAAFWQTDGSDGVIQFLLTSAVVGSGPRALFCEYEVQGYNGGDLITKPFILQVTKRAKVV